MLSTLLAVCFAVVQDKPAIDVSLAAFYFEEARRISDADGGALWGKKLYGPTLFVHAPTGTVVANEEPPAMGLKQDQAVFVGKLPKELLPANTAINWRGSKWSMVLWPLPSTPVERARLMMHESWHRVQEELGLPARVWRNAHLDTKEGRIWLQLEIRALRQVMLTEPRDMKPLIEDALAFRAYRQQLFPSAKVEEDAMEVHEGLAEFTGMMLRGTWQPETRYGLAYRMQWFHQKRSFPASFAYETGPAYGLLLNLQEEPWRTKLTGKSSLADMVAALRGITVATDIKTDAIRRAERYGLHELTVVEESREKERLAKDASYRKLLVDGPVLELPLLKMSFTYDPGSVFPLGPEGTVYPGTKISDVWGTLTVTGVARITSDFSKAYVPAAKEGELKGEGWTLELNAGWAIVPSKRSGDYVLARR